jgi:hypothetical protein
MEWGEAAAERELVLKAAVPEPSKVWLPRLLVPSKKEAVPVATPPLPVTVAVNVSTLPANAGFCEEASVVALEPRMLCKSTLEVLLAKALLPP